VSCTIFLRSGQPAINEKTWEMAVFRLSAPLGLRLPRFPSECDESAQERTVITIAAAEHGGALVPSENTGSRRFAAED
jgi:hypothetical protein